MRSLVIIFAVLLLVIGCATYSSRRDLEVGMTIGAAKAALLASGAEPQNMPPGFDEVVWKLSDGRLVVIDVIVRPDHPGYEAEAAVSAIYLWDKTRTPVSRLTLSQ